MVAGVIETGGGGEGIEEEVGGSMEIVAGMEVEGEEEMNEVARENQRIGPNLLEEMKSWRRNCLEVAEDQVGSTLTDMRISRSRQLVLTFLQP